MNISKKILMRCLITGIIIGNLTSCKGKVDYGWDAEWYYSNITAGEITVVYGKNAVSREESFSLAPGQTYSFKTCGFTKSLTMTEKDYYTPYSINGATVTIDSCEPVFYSGFDYYNKSIPLESICNIENYKAKKLGTNRFRFTYIFK